MKTTVRGDKTEVIRLRVSKAMKKKWEEHVAASGQDEGSLSAYIRRIVDKCVDIGEVRKALPAAVDKALKDGIYASK